MRRITLLLLLPILFLSTVSMPSQTDEDRIDKLTPEHRKWLEEEVAYIILDRERDVFISLDTVEERNRFIEAFWRKRDPNRATPENEFKDEHYRRFEYANKFLGRDTLREGWRTDRGRMYIILGEPAEIQRFDGYEQLVPQHLWFYMGDPTKGLPNFFYILFFKSNMVGEFRIYSPFADGPNRLLQGEHGIGGSAQQALRVLRDASPDLARASLSFDTSDQVDLRDARPSLGSDIVLARIYESPKRAIRSEYADAFLEYGDRVSAEYSFNYIPSRSHFAVLNGPDETPFVNYSIEIDPENFTVENDEAETKFYTTLDVSVEARNKEGVLVLSRDRQSYLELDAEEFRAVRTSPFSYQANFPLLPGDYKISVILKNRVLTRYTVAETELAVPASSPDQLVLSDVILGYSVEALQRTSGAPDELRTFQLGSARVNVAAGGIFSLGETIHVYLQVQGADADSELHFALLDGDELIQERTTAMSTYLGGPVIERFPLRGMVGGRYVMRVRVLDASGGVLAERSAPCQVSPRENIRRPWFMRVSFNTATPGLLALARGNQFVAEKRLEQAKVEFEKAIASGGRTVAEARARLAWISIRTGESARGLELLTPLEQEFPDRYEVVAGLGLGYSLEGDCQKGISYLERAMTLRPPDTVVLNVAGDCYMTLGDDQRATEAFERSLTLNPEQPRVKEVLSSIQGNNH